MYKSHRYTPSSRLSGWGYCVGLFIFAVAATGLILGAVSLSKIHSLAPASTSMAAGKLTTAQLAAVQGEIDALRASKSNGNGVLEMQLHALEIAVQKGQGSGQKIDKAMQDLQASQRRLGFVEEAYNRLAKSVQSLANEKTNAGYHDESSSSSSSDDDDDDSSSSSSSSDDDDDDSSSSSSSNYVHKKCVKTFCDVSNTCPEGNPEICLKWFCEMRPSNDPALPCQPVCVEGRIPGCQIANITALQTLLSRAIAVPDWKDLSGDAGAVSMFDEAGPVSVPRTSEVLPNAPSVTQCTVVRYGGTQLCLASLHSLVYAALPVNPVTDLNYKNFAPDQLMTTEMANLFNYNNIDRQTGELRPRFETFFSDCWGFLYKTYNTDGYEGFEEGDAVTVRFSLITSQIGMYIMRKEAAVTGLKSRYDVGRVQYIDFAKGAGTIWGDVKVYDVTVFSAVVQDASAIPAPGSVINLRDAEGNLYPTSLLSATETATPGVCRMRVKCDFVLSSVPSSLATDDGNIVVVAGSPSRTAVAYVVKEGVEGMLVVDLMPLIDEDDAVVVKDFSLVPDDPWVIDGNVVLSSGRLTGAHNVYVNEQVALLIMNGGGSVDGQNIDGSLVFQLDDGVTGQAAFDPVPTHYFPGGVTVQNTYTHDSVIVAYTHDEQHALLGLPHNETCELLVLAVTCDGDQYTLQNITNLEDVRVLSSLAISFSGYYHQVWFTTDKRYFVISDEVLPEDNRNYNRVPIARVFWNPHDGQLQMFHVQDVQGPFVSAVHNQYTVSNSLGQNPYDKNTFVDWVVGSQYMAGAYAFEITYANNAARGHGATHEHGSMGNMSVDEIFHAETAPMPFVVRQVGFLDTSVSVTTSDLGGSWSVYPFYEVSGIAQDLQYVVSGEYTAVQFRYKENAQNTVHSDGLTDGRVRLLSGQQQRKRHPTDVTQGNAGSLKDEVATGKDSRQAIYSWPSSLLYTYSSDQERVTSAFIVAQGISNDFDLWTGQIISAGETYAGLEPAETVSNGQAVFMIRNGHVISGTVLQNRSTEYQKRINGQRFDVFDDYFQQFQAKERGSDTQGDFAYSYRVGEVVTDLPCRPGDSGGPVVTADGKLVGIIRDYDVAGGTCGLTTLLSGGPLNLFDTPIPEPAFVSSDYTRIRGYFNELRESGSATAPIDRETLTPVVVNPRTGEIVLFLSGTGTRYFAVDNTGTEYVPNEQGVTEELTASNNAVSIINMGGITYYARSFTAFSPNTPTVYRVSVTGGTGPWDASTALFAEIFSGSRANNGPRAVFCGFSETQTGTGNEAYAIFYPVGDSALVIKDLFTDADLSTFDEPKVGDIVTGEESSVTLEVLEVTTESIDIPFTENAFLMYPLAEKSPQLFPFYLRTADALMFTQNYTFSPPLEFIGTGQSSPKPMFGSALGISTNAVAKNSVTGRSHVVMPNSLLLEFYYAAPQGGIYDSPMITGLQFNDEPMQPVDSDSFEYLMKTRKFNADDTISIAYLQLSDDTVEKLAGPIPSKRGAYTNFGYI